MTTAPIEKFRDYIFKPGATHGKERVFRTLGYDRDDSEELARIYEQQGAGKISRGEYLLGAKDKYGQRISIEIELRGVRDAIGKVSYLKSGWTIQPSGDIRLNTPFTGFTR